MASAPLGAKGQRSSSRRWNIIKRHQYQTIYKVIFETWAENYLWL